MNAITLAVRALLIGLLVASFSFAADSKPQSDGSELIARAALAQGIRQPSGKPFFLHMRIHAQGAVSKPMDGVYQELWISPDKWRREIAFPGFQQLEVGDVGSKWVSRNLEFRPGAAYLTAFALNVLETISVLSDETIKSLSQKNNKGGNLQCAELVFKNGAPSRTICFDASGAVASLEWQNRRFEYRDYGKFGDKVFPRSIRVFEDGFKVLDMAADDLAAPPAYKPDVFQHDGSARQMAPCERWPTTPSGKVPPHYPSDARASRQQGAVTLYVLVSPDGRVEQADVLESAAASLDRAAAEAVRQWTYPPVSCGTAPLETEIEVSVNFTLR